MGGGGKSKSKGGGGGNAAQQQHQQKQQPKASKKAADADFDSILKEVGRATVQTAKLEPTQWLALLASAFTMAGMPQVFFHSPVFYDIDLPAYKAQFIGVTIASGLALAYAYVAVSAAHEAKLLAGREADAKGSKEERAAAEEALARSTSLESLSYALFTVNGLYLGLFLTLAFKACEAFGVDPTYTQLLSTLLPAVLLSARPHLLA